MADYTNTYNKLLATFQALIDGRAMVQKFSYTDMALQNANNNVDLNQNLFGVSTYQYSNEQNIPLRENTNTDNVVLEKGIRAQGASITREFQNHFIGRLSFNVNLIAYKLVELLDLVNTVYLFTAGTYDPNKPYDVGDLTYVVVSKQGKGYIKQYQCIAACQNVPPTDPNNWIELYDDIANPVLTGTSVDLDEIRNSSDYVIPCAADMSNVTGLPSANVPANSNIRIVTKNIGTIADPNITHQEIFFQEDMRRFERTFTYPALGDPITVLTDWKLTTDVSDTNIQGFFDQLVFDIPNAGAQKGHLLAIIPD